MHITDEDIKMYDEIFGKKEYIEILAWEVIHQHIKASEDELGGYYKEVMDKVSEIQLESIKKACSSMGNSIGSLGGSIGSSMTNFR